MNPDQELKYLNIIDSLGQIPTLPVVVSQLLKVINHPNSGADNAATLVEKDVALASKVLKLANSSYYGIPRTITSIKSAIVILGFSTVKSLVLSSSVLKIFDDNGEGKGAFDKNAFWNHSIEVAMMSKSIARLSRSKGIDGDLAFSGGLLHDIGKLILAQYSGPDYQEVLDAAVLGEKTTQELEKELIGITHCDISSMLLERWGIPESLQIPVKFHYEPREAPEYQELSKILYVADHLSGLNESCCIKGEKLLEFDKTILDDLGINKNPKDLLEHIRGDLSEVAEFIALIQGS